MQAIELQAQITASHEIHLKLPDEITAQTVKVIVMYEQSNFPAKKRIFGQFRDQIKIADDFDEELPVDFWLGQSQ